MSSYVKITGLDKFKKSLDDWVVKADVAAEKIVRRGAIILVDHTKKEFLPRPGGRTVSQRTGRVYYKGAPSFPATPPNPTNRSGNLSHSLNMLSVTRLGAGRWMSVTGTNLMYAPYVEFGTTRSRPFPFLEMGLKESMMELEELSKTTWEEAQL